MKKTIIKEKKPIGNIILHIVVGFLIPYVLINFTLFFYLTACPKITVKEQNENDYNVSEIEFSVSCPIPFFTVDVTNDDVQVKYNKVIDKYIIPVKTNGTYKITATCINKATQTAYAVVNYIDETPPTINTETAILSTGTLTFTINDTQSGINYDKLYGIDENGNSHLPTFIEKSTGTIQFKMDNIKELTIHLEDTIGNSSDTSFGTNNNNITTTDTNDNT